MIGGNSRRDRLPDRGHDAVGRVGHRDVSWPYLAGHDEPAVAKRRKDLLELVVPELRMLGPRTLSFLDDPPVEVGGQKRQPEDVSLDRPRTATPFPQVLAQRRLLASLTGQTCAYVISDIS